MDAQKEIGYYEDAVDSLADGLETLIQHARRLLLRKSSVPFQKPGLRSTRQAKHDRRTTHEWLRSRMACSNYQDADNIWKAPEPEDVLQNMLEEVGARHLARYGEFLQRPGTCKELKDRLLAPAWNFFQSKDYSCQKLVFYQPDHSRTTHH